MRVPVLHGATEMPAYEGGDNQLPAPDASETSIHCINGHQAAEQDSKWCMFCTATAVTPACERGNNQLPAPDVSVASLQQQVL
jgi:hypothetical protein